MTKTKLFDLVEIIYDYLIGLDHHHLGPFLAKWPAKPFKTRMVSQQSLPVLSYLPELVAGAKAETETIVHLLVTLAEDLSWGQTYSLDDFGPAFLAKYGWTELIGLRGPIASDDIACGCLLLGPDIEYPRHSHEAEEVYIPLSGPAWWVRGNGHWASRPIGVPIYHRSWLTHGMRTEAAPLLALYLWHGGHLAQKSHID
ncbi:MAG: transcriptional regulator [Anaerolineaceae bacterium]|nr:transcriptional regulator [Anaerolineaceae bacterium]